MISVMQTFPKEPSISDADQQNMTVSWQRVFLYLLLHNTVYHVQYHCRTTRHIRNIISSA